jgi:hypothetical protein
MPLSQQPLNLARQRSRPSVGAGLLAKASGQLKVTWLTHRHRGQARSYSFASASTLPSAGYTPICRSRLAGEGGGSAIKVSTDTTGSPASRLLRLPGQGPSTPARRKNQRPQKSPASAQGFFTPLGYQPLNLARQRSRPSVGAGLLANPVNRRSKCRLTRLVRQHAGSYDCRGKVRAPRHDAKPATTKKPCICAGLFLRRLAISR